MTASTVQRDRGQALARSTTPADEVHDFQSVAVVQGGCGPVIAADNVVVQLHSHPVGFQAQLIYQSRERHFVAEAAFFAIDDKFH